MHANGTATRQRGPAALAVAGALCGMLLIAGIVRLFLLRFEAGDVYPPYSSLRSDPLGTRALYESLAECPGLTVERNLQNLDSLRLTPETTLLFLGDTITNDDSLPEDVVGRLNGFLRRGGRIVFAFLPAVEDPLEQGWRHDEDPDPAASDESAGEQEDEKQENEEEELAEDEPPYVTVNEWLDIECGYEAGLEWTDAQRSDEAAFAALPSELSCHTALYFRRYEPEETNAAARPPATPGALPGWRTVYAREGRPVIIERPFGRGSLVLSALSFPVSNEALRRERSPALLAWLVGNATRIVFDETHHGLSAEPTIGTLARRYGLHALLGALILLALLFVWRNSTSLVPPEPEAADDGSVTGQGAAAGLVNLLRRNIPRDRLLRECLDTWHRAPPRGHPAVEREYERMREIVDREERLPRQARDPGRAYNEMADIARRRGLPADRPPR